MQAVNYEISLDAYVGDPCPYCGKQMKMKRWREPSRDHILPRSLGGSGRALNTLVVCFRCNQVKANMHPDAWVAWLREFRPHRADQVAAIYAARAGVNAVAPRFPYLIIPPIDRRMAEAAT